ncbi:helix-turn-helix domain-containing protein [Streptomyces noursei]|uniref:helix-turn-helix domain-containing protein n=1 Tax=Streptomyces noursei TaxID=1971 RepID=UPI00045EE118|nr:helix-turn-helix domain-containing protein [Streptomyces noursei]AIA03483.1 hypothetical protein DC74_2983 [Streptomyces noursei]
MRKHRSEQGQGDAHSASFSDAKKAVARRLRHVRKHHPEGPFTLAALAERSGVSQRALALAESAEGANVTLETLVKVGHSLGITRVGYFVDEEVFDQVNQQLATLANMRDRDIASVALRASSGSGVSGEAVQELSVLLNSILDHAAKARGTLRDLPGRRSPRTPPPGDDG